MYKDHEKPEQLTCIRLRSRALAVFRRCLLRGAPRFLDFIFNFDFDWLRRVSMSNRFWIDLVRKLYLLKIQFSLTVECSGTKTAQQELLPVGLMFSMLWLVRPEVFKVFDDILLNTFNDVKMNYSAKDNQIDRKNTWDVKMRSRAFCEWIEAQSRIVQEKWSSKSVGDRKRSKMRIEATMSRARDSNGQALLATNEKAWAENESSIDEVDAQRKKARENIKGSVVRWCHQIPILTLVWCVKQKKKK